MKLAEAKITLSSIRSKLEDLKSRVDLIPLQKVPDVLNSISELAAEERFIRRSIFKVENEFIIYGSCINELELMIYQLEEQITLLRNISKRVDLPEVLQSMVFSQLDNFTKTKSSLESALQKASWEIEI